MGVLALLLALLLPGDPGGGDGPGAAPAPGPAAPSAAPGRAEVAAALGSWERDLRRGPAAALDLRDLAVRLAGDVAPGPGARATATAAVTWRLPRGVPTTSRVAVEVAAPARVVSVGAAGGALPLWLAGPVRVRTSSSTLVVAATGQPVARYDRWARQAVATVRRTLPGRPRRLLVEVPADAAGLDVTLGTPPGSSAGIAAVTTTTGGPTRVVVDPDVLGSLRPRGAAVVLAHEAVHVATDAAGERSGSVPLWLREGFADHVALRAVDLPVRRTAAQVRALVRRDGVPADLPRPVDLAPGAPDLGASYEAAWLACEVLAERAGERGLVRLYERVDAGAPWGASLRAATGWGRSDLVRAWQERLRALARGGAAQAE